MNTPHFFLKATIMLIFISGNFISGSYAQNDYNYFSALTNKNIVFKTNNTERMRITSDGLIGIGGIPTEKLEINGNLKVSGSITTNEFIVTGATSFDSLHVANKIKIGNSIILGGGGQLGNNDNNIFTDNPDAIYIQSNSSYPNNTIINATNAGKVGIGTTDPQEKIEVNGAGRFGNTTDYVNIGSNSTNSFIETTKDLLINNTSGKNVIIGKDADKKNVDGGVSIWENVGIGTDASTDQALKLHIKGYTEYCSGISCSTSAIIRIEDELYGDPNTDRNAWWDFVTSAQTHQFYIISNSGNGTNNNDVLTMTEDGKVGVGITNPKEKLQIGNSFVIHDGGSKVIARNFYYSGQDKRIEDGKSAAIYFGDGEISLKTAPDGYANSNITWADGLILKNDGKVGIGTTNFSNGIDNDYYKLAVKGKVHAEEVVVNTVWPDFVFDKSYKLKSVSEVEQYINEHKHLPDVPSADEVAENGVSLGQSDSILLQKIEELTLYIIEQNKRIEALEKQQK